MFAARPTVISDFLHGSIHASRFGRRPWRGSVCMLAALVALSVQAGAQSDYFELRFSGRSEHVANLLAGRTNVGGRNALFIIDPMRCPRCEGVAVQMMERLGAEWNGTALVVVAYPRLNAAVEYARRRRFPFEVVVDTSGRLVEELGLHNAVPFVTVWDSTARLLYAKAIYGVDTGDSLLWHNLHHAMPVGSPDAVPAPVLRASTVGMNAPHADWRTPTPALRVRLQDDTAQPFGTLGYAALSPDRATIALTDHLTLTPSVFEVRTGRRLHRLAPEFELRKAFSPDIGKAELYRYERSGVANTMSFGNVFRGPNALVSSMSLPEFKVSVVADDVGDSVASVGYYNAATLVERAVSSGRIRRITRLYPDLKSSLSVSHASMTPAFCDARHEVFLVTGKGYPYVGTNTSAADGAGNPLAPEFYDDAPLFTGFRMSDGQPTRRIGRLGDAHRRLGTGYAFAAPRIAFDGPQWYITQNLLPYVDCSSGRRIALKSYFNAQLLGPGPMRSTLPSIVEIGYLADSSGAVINAVGARRGSLMVVWYVKKKGTPLIDDYYTVVQKYSVRTGRLVGEWLIPATTPDGTLSDCTLNPHADECLAIYQTATTSTFVAYRIE